MKRDNEKENIEGKVEAKSESKAKSGIGTRLKEALLCFWTFFKIGIICFGGGYAMISLVERDLVEKKGWISSDEMLEIIAIAESTPGAIAINMATYIGAKRAGILGAIFATLGVVTPSFIIIFAISFFIVRFKEIKWVAFAFKGIRAGVLVLILGAVIKLMKKLERSVFAALIVITAFLAKIFFDIDVILLLLIFAAAGLVYNAIKRAAGGKK